MEAAGPAATEPQGGGAPMISLERVSKQFGDQLAVDDVSIDIGTGEFFSMLGPSGCGKTTSLRMIAGFEEPTAGRVMLAGEDVTLVSPRRRKVNMVFQDYALFPHMTVAENVSFGLRLKKVGKAEERNRVAEILKAMQLEEFIKRRPAQLSGGQRQRVALARALVNRPAALLLDEPLGALDLKLRKEMQLELKAIQQRTGTTFVYVTHDQEEALTMSDRIAVMSNGKVEQIDSPRELYNHPATSFVADFIGISNRITFVVDRREGDLAVMDLGDGRALLAGDPGGTADEVTLTVRPEKIKLRGSAAAGHDCLLGGTLAELIYLGSMTQAVVDADTGDRLVVHLLNDAPGDDELAGLRPGDEVTLGWASDQGYVIGSAKAPSA
ncbi:MAG: ABC transporter ATP-binding protein [Solirubrobacterales bacterium]